MSSQSPKISRRPHFRKVALALWGQHGDPSVYGFVELDVTQMKNKSNLLAMITKATGQTMKKNTELTSMIKWGGITQRKDCTISLMVNIPETQKDLSAMNLEDTDRMTIEAIQNILNSKSRVIRSHQDPHLGPVLKIIRFIPRPILKMFLGLYSFLIYELETRLGITPLPLRPFGSVIISNVGSLGIKKALLPLVPLARATMMMSIGKISKEPKVIDEAICIREIVNLGITFDHRLFDGSHAAKMLNDFQESFEALLKNESLDDLKGVS
ncbi:MAG: hypothetical protein RJB66_1139 [Pseudomonadota bacterium]|jgi:hypothetical protein